MLQGQQKLSPTHRFKSVTSNGVNANLKSDLDELERLHCQRRKQLELVSSLKQTLSDLEQTENEEIGELDFERSLLSGELEAESEKVRKVRTFNLKINFLRLFLWEFAALHILKIVIIIAD